MNEQTHFAETVAPEIQVKLKDLADLINEDFIGEYSEGYGCSNISPIYGRPVSGFIPFQDGGYQVSDLKRFDEDTTYHLTKAQSEYMQQYARDCWREFCTDVLNADDPESVSYEDLNEDQRSALADYENDWFEPVLFSVDVWIARPAKVYMRVSLNYRDAPYYREQYGTDLFELQFEIPEFMNTENTTIIEKLKTGMAGVSA